VVFLDVLAVVRLAIGQPEQSFFNNGIFAIPQSQGETEMQSVVGYAGQTVFSPAVSPRTSLVVAEVVPRIPGVTGILPYRSPLSLTEIGPPLLPTSFLSPILFKSQLFSVHQCTLFLDLFKNPMKTAANSKRLNIS